MLRKETEFFFISFPVGVERGGKRRSANCYADKVKCFSLSRTKTKQTIPIVTIIIKADKAKKYS